MGSIGELAALGTAFCWTFTAISFESAGRRVGSLSVNLIRLIMAACLLTFFNGLVRGRALPLDASLHAWLWLTISGWIGFCIGDLCLFRAFVLIGARRSMLLLSLVPPITGLAGAFFLGERLARADWIGMALTVGGVSWVVSEGPAHARRGGRLRVPAEAAPEGETQGSRATGILLGLGAAAGQAIGLILSKYGMRDYDAFAATQIRVLAGVVGFAAIFLVIRWWPRVGRALRHPGAMARIAVGATFGPFLGVSLSLLAVQHTQAGVASTIMSIVPVLIIGPSVLFFKERVTLRAVVGAVAAVGGVAVLFLT